MKGKYRRMTDKPWLKPTSEQADGLYVYGNVASGKLPDPCTCNMHKRSF